MEWTIPGTVLSVTSADAGAVEDQFRAMFLGGGIVLSQVSAVTGLESHDIQNWVKRGFLTPPVNKRYTLRQLCRITNINMLRGALPLERICGMLGYINGQLDDESDDLIDDSQLYFLFIRLAAHYRQMQGIQGRESFLAQVMEDYQEPFPGAGKRVENVLRIMLTAWAAAQLRQVAEGMIQELSV